MVVSDEKLQIPHWQELVVLENGRVGGIPHQSLARFVPNVSRRRIFGSRQIHLAGQIMSWQALTNLSNLCIAMMEEFDELGPTRNRLAIHLSALRSP